MKNTIAIILFIITTVSQSQDFEGDLTYFVDFQVSQKMIDKGVNKEILKGQMESEGVWADTIKSSYKAGFYQQLNLSKDKTWVIYRPDVKQLYTFQDGEDSDLCIITDASIDLEYQKTGEMPKVVLLDTLVKYQNYRLEVVQVTWKSGIYYYYFDKNHLRVNPEDFKGHIYDGFYAFLKLSKSLPIRIVKDANYHAPN